MKRTEMKHGVPTRVFQRNWRTLPETFERSSQRMNRQSYEVFIREVLPVARQANVKLQLFLNDPPMDHQGILDLQD